MRHFIENYNDNGFNNLRFTIIYCLNNVAGLTDDEIDIFFSKKKVLDMNNGHETSWFKSRHDLNRKKRCDHEKLKH